MSAVLNLGEYSWGACMCTSMYACVIYLYIAIP